MLMVMSNMGNRGQHIDAWHGGCRDHGSTGRNFLGWWRCVGACMLVASGESQPAGSGMRAVKTWDSALQETVSRTQMTC